MRRVIVIAVLILVGGGAALLALGASSGSSKPSFSVELDNAFGLSTGVDMKIAGVKAGKVSKLDVDPRTHKALIGFTLSKQTAPLRVDATCNTRPENLIGEYFVDCQPGHAKRKLPPGGIIPVTQTTSSVPADLIGNIMRLPYRERLRILIDELGSGLAARGSDLNAAVHRAVPALRQTDRVLAILADQRRTIQNLTTNANTVVTALANNGRNVARFVDTANNTAVATAQRKTQLAQTFQQLPGFLRELIPAMHDLGVVADRQTPALADLRLASPDLTRFLNDLPPFANAAVPAVRALGDASVTGRQAVAAATPTVALLRQFTRPTPELARNLRIILRHLDDRRNAIESDPRAAAQQGVPYRAGVNGTGYSGIEALMQYLFDQSLAVNQFGSEFHILRLALTTNGCMQFMDAQQYKAAGSKVKNCSGFIGPNQPGINAPDYTHPVAGRAATAPARAKAASAPRPAAAKKSAGGALPGALQGLLGGIAGPRSATAPAPAAPAQPAKPQSAARPSLPRQAPPRQGQGALLNYLLGP